MIFLYLYDLSYEMELKLNKYKEPSKVTNLQS